MRLSESQISQLHAEGYLTVEGLFDQSDLQPVRDEITRAIDRHAARLIEDGRLSRSYAEESFETRLTRITAETDALYWSLVSGKLHGLGIFGLLTNAKLLDLVE